MSAARDSLLIFDREASRAVDRAAIGDYGIPGIVLMENASRALAFSVSEMLRSCEKGTILIVCGSGNNGGDGYAAARHLHNAGFEVILCAVGKPRTESDAAINRTICQHMNLSEIAAKELLASQKHPALLIDAIFGTGLDRPVEGEAAKVIAWMNAARQRGSLILAADIPSGLDCDTGRELGIAVRADRTVSFLGWKKGFLQPQSKRFTGEVAVGDIGAPAELVKLYALKHEDGAPT